MSLMVIGTDTGVGKTVISAILLSRYARNGPLAYWKPVATGRAEGSDSEVVRSLCGPDMKVLPEEYLFDPPVSPHLAARWAHVTIDPARIIERYRAYRKEFVDHHLIIEGIGGLLVPFNDQGFLLADLISMLDLPCLLTTSSRVGTINHTLLTLEALRSRRITLAGVVMNGALDTDNRFAIEQFGQVRVIDALEPLAPLTRSAVIQRSRSFDPEGTLAPWLESENQSS